MIEVKLNQEQKDKLEEVKKIVMEKGTEKHLTVSRQLYDTHTKAQIGKIKKLEEKLEEQTELYHKSEDSYAQQITYISEINNKLLEENRKKDLELVNNENNYKAHEQRQLTKIKVLEEEVEKWKNKYIYALEKLLMK